MLALAILGLATFVGGLFICRAANNANNDGAWVLYGCIPTGIGVMLIAAAILGKVL